MFIQVGFGTIVSMKITLLSENLKKGLNLVSRVVSSRPSLPILSGVLLKADSSGLSLVSTDLEMSFWLKIAAKVEGEGEFVLPAGLFRDLVVSLPPGNVVIEKKEEKVMVSINKISTELSALNAEDFPSVPRIGESQMELSAGEFKEKIDRVCVSSAKDDSRPVLTGVLWDLGEDLVIVATDGYRLSIDKMVFKKKDEKLSGKYILPARSLLEVSRVLAETGEDKVLVVFDKDNQQVIFGLKEVEIASRLIAGEFPPYQQILPNTYSTKVEFKRLDLLEAVKRAKLFAKDNANIVKIMIDKEVMLVSAESGQFGKSKTELEVLSEGEKVEVAFNANYLVDYLSVSKSEVVYWETEGELKPSVFKVGEEGWLQVVMPVRVS